MEPGTSELIVRATAFTRRVLHYGMIPFILYLAYQNNLWPTPGNPYKPSLRPVCFPFSLIPVSTSYICATPSGGAASLHDLASEYSLLGDILAVQDVTSKKIRWVPLESNPQVMNRMLRRLGVAEGYGFNDIWGLDPELLAMVPQPCLAVLLLFPVTPAYERHFQEVRRQPQTHGDPRQIFFMKQTIGNACGTMAVLHALINARDRLSIEPDGPLQRFMDRALGEENPAVRASLLENSTELADAHRDSAVQGQTEAPDAETATNLHFVCLVSVGGRLVELDGSKDQPIDHGPCTDVLTDSARVAKEFMARDPDNVQFNLVSLGPMP
ncbi:ubiquitinyl hydrolase 1 [Dispira simplex]|nr:ubiquitinyl hydrolase 1 [Dispira simplex]